MSDDLYQAWIEQRRAAAPPDELPDRVMRLVMELQSQQQQVFARRLASWIERSRWARYAACGAAMLIGSMPFVTYFAYLMWV
jgi:hypothetical protein